MIWEYLVQTIGYLKLENELNRLGKMRWEVCFMVEAVPSTSAMVVLKRQKIG